MMMSNGSYVWQALELKQQQQQQQEKYCQHSLQQASIKLVHGLEGVAAAALRLPHKPQRRC
jgi:hypothetical protein